MKSPLFIISLVLTIHFFPSYAKAQDFADPSSFITPPAKSIEIQGEIQSATTAKPGWYAVIVDLGNGKTLRVFVSPATKFWGPDPQKQNGFPYIPVAVEKAHSMITSGKKIRAMHKTEMDLALHLIWISDLLFVEK